MRILPSAFAVELTKSLIDIFKKRIFPCPNDKSAVPADNIGVHQGVFIVQRKHFFEILHRYRRHHCKAGLAALHWIRHIDQHTHHALALRADAGKHAQTAVLQYLLKDLLALILYLTAVDQFTFAFFCIQSKIFKIPNLCAHHKLVNHFLSIFHFLWRMPLYDSLHLQDLRINHCIKFLLHLFCDCRHIDLSDLIDRTITFARYIYRCNRKHNDTYENQNRKTYH